MSDGPAPRSYVGNDYQRTRTEMALDYLTNWRLYIVIGVIAAVFAARLGWIDIPHISDLHKLLTLGVIGGYVVVGKWAVWPVVSDRIEPNTVPLYITGLDGDRILDCLDIPEEDWWRFETINGLTERRTIGGSTVFVARAVDLKNELIVAAGDRPADEEVPDYIDLLGSGASEMYHQLRGIVIEEFREGTNRKRDSQIMQEEAVRETNERYNEDMESFRNGKGVQEEREQRSQERVPTESVLRERAADESAQGGESDE